MVFSATLTPGHLYGKPMTLTCAWFFYDISYLIHEMSQTCKCTNKTCCLTWLGDRY